MTPHDRVFMKGLPRFDIVAVYDEIFKTLQLLDLDDDDARRRHLLWHHGSWDHADRGGCLDELLGCTDASEIAGFAEMEPPQLINALRERTHLREFGPAVHYEHLKDLSDTSSLAVLRSKYELEDAGRKLRNCAMSYAPRVQYGDCVLVMLRDASGKPTTLGQFDMATAQWVSIRETCNRMPTDATRAIFTGYAPAIQAWQAERRRKIAEDRRSPPSQRPARPKQISGTPPGSKETVARELDYFGLVAAVFGARPWTDGATFRPGPAMGEGRAWCAAVAAGGRVVVFGGFSGKSALDSTELLDTQTMAFTGGPDMPTVRFGCAAVQIDGNRVLVVGGADYDDKALNTTEIFHLSTLTFAPGPDMQTARFGCAAVALDARRVLVVGGHDDASELSSTEILSLDTMAFAPGPAMTTPRNGCAAVALDEHRILVAGGESDSGLLNTTEIFDVQTMAFAAGPSMSSARLGCAAVSVDAQHVLIIGGDDSSLTGLATTELLDVAMLEFEPGPRGHGSPLRQPTMAPAMDGTLVRGDGLQGAASKDGLQGSASKDGLQKAAADSAAATHVAKPDAVTLNVGGVVFETSRAVLTNVDDSMLGRMFGRCAEMLQPHADGSISMLRDGKLFESILEFLFDVDGPKMQKKMRLLYKATQDLLLQELDYFGLETAVFGEGPDMLQARYGCAAVQLDEGRVLIEGGADDKGVYLNSTEIFHLSSETFTHGPPLRFKRKSCAAISLDARRILVIGGFDGTTEVLDVDTLVFTKGPKMRSARCFCCAAAVDERHVLVFGGKNSDYLPQSTAELLDIGMLEFENGPRLQHARYGCCPITAGRNGPILILGGVDGHKGRATTELLSAEP
ncbi:hypothetical protein M885DRAFT_570081 [Pelagophyceae sp. CCMP2097]|nr:hypothetical protein M885DRAFT_570081 [Pelagophyceae sp. CCMP2097]